MPNKRKQPPPRPLPPGRTAQQPMAQTGADLMRAIGNLIPVVGPLNPGPGSDVNWQARRGGKKDRAK
jgi:hypothetical protein